MGEVLLEGRNLVKSYTTRAKGRRPETLLAVDDVSLRVHQAQTLAVVGESGSGKSTSARLLSLLIPATAGSVYLEGTDVTQATESHLRTFRRNVQLVFQDPYSSLNPRHDVERIVSAPLRYQGIRTKVSYRTRVKDLMDRVGLNPDHSTRYPHQFSGGQAQRIGIARALAVNPKVVICDEAVSALDVSVQAQVIDLLQDLKRDLGLSYLFIAHDLAVVREIADRVAVMHKGKVVEEGPCAQIFDAPGQAYTQELLAAVPRIPTEWDAARIRAEAASADQTDETDEAAAADEADAAATSRRRKDDQHR